MLKILKSDTRFTDPANLDTPIETWAPVKFEGSNATHTPPNGYTPNQVMADYAEMDKRNAEVGQDQ